MSSRDRQAPTSTQSPPTTHLTTSVEGNFWRSEPVSKNPLRTVSSGATLDTRRRITHHTGASFDYRGSELNSCHADGNHLYGRNWANALDEAQIIGLSHFRLIDALFWRRYFALYDVGKWSIVHYSFGNERSLVYKGRTFSLVREYAGQN